MDFETKRIELRDKVGAAAAAWRLVDDMVIGALTFKQYRQCMGLGTWENFYEKVQKVSKSAKLHALARQALELKRAETYARVEYDNHIANDPEEKETV